MKDVYLVRLNWENGKWEEREFENYNEVLWYILDNSLAGYMVWRNGEQMNEVDIGRDVELIF